MEDLVQFLGFEKTLLLTKSPMETLANMLMIASEQGFTIK